MEKHEDDLMELFAKEAKVADVSKDLCSKRTKLCKKKQLWERDELWGCEQETAPVKRVENDASVT